MKLREISRILPATQTYEGDGMPVQRTFPTRSLDHIDPFLLLDHFGPQHVKPGEGKGVPPHPHRGFQTVTYMLSGEFEHRDSAGNHGIHQPRAVDMRPQPGVLAGRGDRIEAGISIERAAQHLASRFVGRDDRPLIVAQRGDAVADLVANLQKQKALDWLLEHVEVVDEAGTAINRDLLLGRSASADDTAAASDAE